MADIDRNWRELPSPADQKWAASFGTAYLAPFNQAVLKDEGNRVYYICKRFTVTREQRYQAFCDAVTAGAETVVQSLLDCYGFDLTESSALDKKAALDILNLALESKQARILVILSNYDNGNHYSQNSLVAAYIKNDWREGFDAMFSDLSKGKGGLYRVALVAAAGKSDEWVSSVLGYTGKFTDVQEALDRALVEATDTGSVTRVQLLLDAGADPNYGEAGAFLKAAEKRDVDMVKAMVAHGLQLEKYGTRVLAGIKKLKLQSPVVQYLEEELPKIVTKVIIRKQEDSRYSIAAKSILKDTLDLHEGPRLTTLFNFETRQQITIVETKNNMTTTVKDFSELDQEVITRAAETLKKLDGDTDGFTGLGKKRVERLPFGPGN